MVDSVVKYFENASRFKNLERNIELLSERIDDLAKPILTLVYKQNLICKIMELPNLMIIENYEALVNNIELMLDEWKKSMEKING